MWLDLHRGILEEFVDRAVVVDPTLQVSRAEESRARCASPAERSWRGLLATNRRRRRRLAEAAKRPPCPQCGAAVVRLGTTGTVPKYCSWRCMQTAKVLRFKARHAKEAM